MQCQAKAKSTGVQCRRHAVSGKRVCTVHGGLTPSGPASANYKHGRYSRYLPARLAERYLEAESDPELLSLRSELALVQATLAGLFGKLDTPDARAVFF